MLTTLFYIFIYILLRCIEIKDLTNGLNILHKAVRLGEDSSVLKNELQTGVVVLSYSYCFLSTVVESRICSLISSHLNTYLIQNILLISQDGGA